MCILSWIQQRILVVIIIIIIIVIYYYYFIIFIIIKIVIIVITTPIQVVMTQATHLYFDHPYEPDPEERGYYWATRYTDTRKAFGFMPDDIMSIGNHCAHILIKSSPYQHQMSGCIASLTASFCSIYPQYLLFLSFSILFWCIKLSPYQHQCCTVSLIASFCSINPQYLPFLSIFLHP